MYKGLFSAQGRPVYVLCSSCGQHVDPAWWNIEPVCLFEVHQNLGYFFICIFLGILKSVFRTLSYPAYTLMLVANILNVMVYGASVSFGPKYLEVQFNVPAWQSNIVLGEGII